MAEVFISYSRHDTDFVYKLVDALAAHERKAWVDWKDIPPTAEWQQEIFSSIEAADNFVFVISPESVASAECSSEIAHAAANKKRILPVLYRSVPDHAIPAAIGKYQRVDFSDGDHFDSTFSTLIKALDTDLAWTQAHTRFLIRAREWERNAKDSSFVLRGKDLRDAEQWLAKSAKLQPEPSTLQSQYILASRHAATIIQRIIIGAVTVAFAVAVGLAVYAFREKDVAVENETEAKRQRDMARGRQLVSTSLLSQDADPELSLFFAAQAVAATWPWGHVVLPEAEQELHRWILASHVRLTLTGHSDVVRSVAWSPDGKRLATGSVDGTARVWDAATGKELLILSGHRDSVFGVAWSPDGTRLATASPDGTAKVWDLATGKELLTLSGHNKPVLSVAWSADGKRLATGSEDRTARVWDAATGAEFLTLRGHSEAVWSVAWSPDGNRLATGSNDFTAKLWDTRKGKELRTLRGHLGEYRDASGKVHRFGGGTVTSVAWSPDGERLATGSLDQTWILWDAATGEELQRVNSDSLEVESLAWSPDGKRLATGTGDNTAKVWDAASGELLLTLRGHTNAVLSVAWSPDGNRLTTASWDHSIKVWDVGPPKELAVIDGTGRTPFALSPDGKRLATVTDETDDKTVKVWDTETGKEVLALRGHTRSVNGVAWSPEGNRLATISDDTTARVWDATTGKQVLTLRGHRYDVLGLAWRPAGKQLATAAISEDSVKLWDTQSGKELLTLSSRNHEDVRELAWSPDGTRLAGEADFTATVWDAETGKILLNLGDNTYSVERLSWSPDGKRLAAGSDDSTARVWDAQTGKQLLSLGAKQERVVGGVGVGPLVAWSPDGKRLATASDFDGIPRIWNAHSGELELTLSSELFHVTPVHITTLAWSPDGKRLVTGTSSQDDTAKVWDATSGRELATLSGHRNSISGLDWTSDGRWLVAESAGRIQVYAMDIPDLMELARQRVTAHPSEEGCKKYLHVDRCPPFPELPFR